MSKAGFMPNRLQEKTNERAKRKQGERMEREQFEFWAVVIGFGTAAVGWIIKTYTTFAKAKHVKEQFSEAAESNDKRFEAMQNRLVKMIDDVKKELRAQAANDKAMGKELHKRIDKVLETSQALTMTIGELKGAMNANPTRQNET